MTVRARRWWHRTAQCGALGAVLGGCGEQVPIDPCDPAQEDGPDDPCACGIEPDLPVSAVVDPAVAFTLERDGTSERIEWQGSAGAAIECRTLDCEQQRVRLVFAAAGGQPRLELEACGGVDATLLTPLALPTIEACGPRDRGFVVRWVDGEVWQSEPDAPTCKLNKTREGGTLVGSFECGALRSPAGTEVRLGGGTFECALGR